MTLPIDDLSYATLDVQLLESIIDSEMAIESFATRLSELQKTCLDMWSQSSPCPSSLVNIRDVVTNVSTLSTHFAEVELKSKEIEKDLLQDIDSLLQNLSIEPEPETIEGNYLTHGDIVRGANFEIIKATHAMKSQVSWQSMASQWLLEHLDNPYPSRNVKQSLCKEFSVALKPVNEWFSQARRRIGWTSVLKRHFMGNRQLAIDCAHQVFAQHCDLALYHSRIIRDVENVRNTAMHLFAEKSRKCDIADDNADRSQRSPSKGRIAEQQFKTLQSRSLARDITKVHVKPQNRERRNRSSDGSSSLRRADYQNEDDCGMPYSRPTKRMRFSGPGSFTRTASSSTTSSRESTLEPLTPCLISEDLPAASSFDSINDWISNVAGEALEMLSQPTFVDGLTRKRRSCDQDLPSSAKRPRPSSTHSFGSEPLFEPPSLLHSDADVLGPKELSELDFRLPSSASFCSAFDEGDLFHFDVYSYAVNGSSPEISAQCDYSKFIPNNFDPCFTEGDRPFTRTEPETLMNSISNVEFSSSCASGLFDHTVSPVEHLGATSGTSNGYLDIEKIGDFVDGHLEKLERINKLLVEAARLQEEVFG